jgi:arylsulfatase A-like enzyme
MKYAVAGRHTGWYEVGLVRIDESSNDGNDFIFSVYEITNGEREKLHEISRGFPKGSWALFEVARSAAGKPSVGETEIEYELRPAGVKARLASQNRASPYYKDFAFLAPAAMPRREPGDLNVILVSFDTLRPDHLSCFGHSRPTSPNIDALARRSTLFTQAVSTAPWTGPAHHSLFTGLYPSASMTKIDGGIWAYQYHAAPSMAAVFSEHGYYTVAFTGGSNLTSARGFNRGFKRYQEANRYSKDNAATVFRQAIGWLEANRDVKFFMFLHTNQCHTPYSDRYFFDQEKPRGYIQKDKVLYDGGIRNADEWFGRFMDKLEEMDLASNTAIVLASDHGDEMYEHYKKGDIVKDNGKIAVVRHGHSLYDEVVRVLVSFTLPGLEAEGKILNNQVRLIDILPTLLDYLGLKNDSPMQGTSLLELIRTGERADDPPAIIEYTAHGPEQKAVRMNGYKYIYTENPDESKSKITFRDIPRYSLFDMKNDPGEKNNIYSENKELAEQYHGILTEALNESSAIRNDLIKQEAPGKKKSEPLPQDVIDGLKTLGYIE